MKLRWQELALATVWLAADQATKAWASARLQFPVSIVPGFLRFELSLNRGALFGWLGTVADPWRTIALTGLPLVAIVAIVSLLLRTARDEVYQRTGLALILGGALGNVIDRVVYGHVVDFIDIYADWQPAAGLLRSLFHVNSWPTFNVADMGLTCGAALLLFEVFVRRSGRGAGAAGEKGSSGVSVPD